MSQVGAEYIGLEVNRTDIYQAASAQLIVRKRFGGSIRNVRSSINSACDVPPMCGRKRLVSKRLKVHHTQCVFSLERWLAWHLVQRPELREGWLPGIAGIRDDENDGLSMA
jgi:hypothetical protein